MITELESKTPNSSVILFFKEWQLCSLDQIKLFDRTEITINIKLMSLFRQTELLLVKEIKLDCKSTDTISLIKANLRKKLGISIDEPVLLTFENNSEKQELNNEEKTLADYIVKNGSTLELITNKLDNEYNGGNFRRMYDEQVLTKLYETYKHKRLSKNDKSYVNNIISMILHNVKPSNYTQSHKNILLLMFKD
jgi:hypothetical protein